jgi:hypothetical protein
MLRQICAEMRRVVMRRAIHTLPFTPGRSSAGREPRRVPAHARRWIGCPVHGGATPKGTPRAWVLMVRAGMLSYRKYTTTPACLSLRQGVA